MQFLLKRVFLICEDIAVYNNTLIYIKGDNNMICDVLLSVSIDSILLPTYSPELNLIELVFNVIVQRFASKYNKSSVKNNKKILLLLNEILDSITRIIFSYYKNTVTQIFIDIQLQVHFIIK